MAITWRNDPERTPTGRSRTRARSLRQNQTEPERKLWWHPRHRLPTRGTHFRRQVPIGPYVADFCCLRAKLIVEVDGETNIARDARRTTYLKAQGYKVQFSDREVMSETTSVLESIYNALVTSTPTPNPSPQGRGEPAGARG